jgi:hypothetical protein
MKTVEIIKPILVGETWHRSGQVELSDEQADDFERRGLVDIVDHDGSPVVWAACCDGGEHEHK